MASAGIRKTPSGRYKVWWRLDDGAQGSQSFDTREQARKFKNDLLARLAQGTWIDPALGKQTFEVWEHEWWEAWSSDPHLSPHTLSVAEGRIRLHLLPYFGQRQLRTISITTVRRGWTFAPTWGPLTRAARSRAPRRAAAARRAPRAGRPRARRTGSAWPSARTGARAHARPG